MELSKAIRGRRSIRNFLDKKLSRASVNKLIDAAIWAPSACNYQGWRFIVIEDKAILGKIVDAGGAMFLRNAPMAILALYLNKSENVEYKDCILSSAMGIQNMLLTAHSLGLGACPVCHLPRKATLRKMFGIPSYYEPVALVAIGYPKITPKPMPRLRKPEEIVCANNFSLKEKKEELPSSALAARRLARKIYYFMPTFVKKKIEPLADKVEKKFDN